MREARLLAHHLDRLAPPPRRPFARRSQPDVPLVVLGGKGRRRERLPPGPQDLHDMRHVRAGLGRLRRNPHVVETVPSRANPKVSPNVLVHLPERLHVHVQPDLPDHAIPIDLDQLPLPQQPQLAIPCLPRTDGLRPSHGLPRHRHRPPARPIPETHERILHHPVTPRPVAKTQRTLLLVRQRWHGLKPPLHPPQHLPVEPRHVERPVRPVGKGPHEVRRPPVLVAMPTPCPVLEADQPLVRAGP